MAAAPHRPLAERAPQYPPRLRLAARLQHRRSLWGGSIAEDQASAGLCAARARLDPTYRGEIPRSETRNYGDVSTAGGVVFYGRASGEFAAVDAKSGAHLWHFETQETWKASPMTYSVNGRQYVAITSGANVLAFALPAIR